ncbi:LysR family transcriptional regulator [Paenibacillus sp.]|uniref:LysR family transcriptional regulator n=1 Tax=Paenibacillus sp. TaxID=58172 RepID=UPI002D556970|nr:LysR family transcriptional regulator [Paenibacillus sp.]HZG57415.1 LysR family transcriptional regulator [Paenibacillus sp.]
MNVAFFESFLEVVRAGSLMKASERLRLSHAAIGKQISAMESHYGVKLFHRSPQGVTPTDEGRLLYDRLLPVCRELRAIEAEMAAARGVGPFAIGALPSVGAYVLPRAALAMEAAGVRVRVEVRETSDELERLLGGGELQAALLELSPDRTDYWSETLFEEPYDVVTYAGHRFAGRASVSVAELAEEPLVLHPPSCTTRRLITGLMADAGVRPNVKAEVQFGDFLLRYVAAGAGICFAPRMITSRMKDEGLAAVPIDDPRAKRAISLVCVSAAVGKTLRPYFDASLLE